MSRPQGHRKSQSTSALAVIAAGGPITAGHGLSGSSSRHNMSQSTSTSASCASSATPRASRRQQPSHSRLGAVIEDDQTNESGCGSPGTTGIDSDLAKLQRAMDERKAVEGTPMGERRGSKSANGIEDMKAELNDVSRLSLSSVLLQGLMV